MHTYRITKRHLEGARIVRETIIGNFPDRHTAREYFTRNIGHDIDAGAPNGDWYTIDLERNK